jgi:hypothetical protein
MKGLMKKSYKAGVLVAIAVIMGSLIKTGMVFPNRRGSATTPTGDLELSREFKEIYSVNGVGAAGGFYRILSITFDRDDNLYVLDAGNSRIAVFDDKGSLRTVFGTRGNGPGELASPTALAVASDGSLLINDNQKRSFLRFAPNGKFITEHPRSPKLGMLWGEGRFAAGADLTVVMHTGLGKLKDTIPTTESVIVKQPLDGMEPTILYRFSSSTGATQRDVRNPPIFSPWPSWTLLPSGGLAVVDGYTYTIRVLGSFGQEKKFSRPIAPRKVTDWDIKEWRRKQEVINKQLRASAGPNSHVVTRDPDKAVFAEYMPLITNIFSDANGRLWVLRPGDGKEKARVDLLGLEGQYIGTFQSESLPDATSPTGLAAFIIKDSLGVEHIAVRRPPVGWPAVQCNGC